MLQTQAIARGTFLVHLTNAFSMDFVFDYMIS